MRVDPASEYTKKGQIAVIGLGYVGLPTAVVFASRGFRVIGVDIDFEKIRAINEGRCYIREPELAELLRDTISKGLLSASADAAEAIRSSDAVIIAVPTPIRNNATDLTYLKSALETIRQGLHKELLVIIESTIPPGTTNNFVKPILEKSGHYVEKDFYLAHVPERIAPGKAIKELLNIPRIVGGIGPRSTEKAIELYRWINPNLLPTDSTTAEFIKLIENTFRDLNIAYSNLLALIAEKLNIDVYEAIRLANSHPRVNIHWPGAGVGGPCLTKDPYILASVAKDIPWIELIYAARKLNEYMPYHTIKIVKNALKENGIETKNARITVLGIAYKGGVGDTRESPAKIIIEELIELGAEVVAYDPYTNESFGAKKASTIKDAVVEADAIVIVTDHPEFRNLNLDAFKNMVRHKIIIDGRRVFEPREVTKKGFKYYGIGFGKVSKT